MTWTGLAQLFAERRGATYTLAIRTDTHLTTYTYCLN